MVELLKQTQYVPYDAIDQCISIFVGSRGFLDDLDLSKVHDFERDLLEYFRGPKKELRGELAKTGSFKGTDDQFMACLKEFKANWTVSNK